MNKMSSTALVTTKEPQKGRHVLRAAWEAIVCFIADTLHAFLCLPDVLSDTRRSLRPLGAKQVLVIVLANLLVVTAFGGYLLLRLPDAANTFFGSALPLCFCVLVPLCCFAWSCRGDGVFALTVCVLIVLGTVLRVMLAASSQQYNVTAKGLLITNLLSMFGGLVGFVFFCALLRMRTSNAAALLCLLSVGCYLLLCLFGSSPNGAQAKAWLVFGNADNGISFQLTEVGKLLGAASMALALNDRDRSGLGRVCTSFAILAGHALFLALLGEFGTLLVLIVAYLCLAVVFLPSAAELKRSALLKFIGAVLAAALVVLIFSAACLCASNGSKVAVLKEIRTADSAKATATADTDAGDAASIDEKISAACQADKERAQILNPLVNRFGNEIWKISCRFLAMRSHYKGLSDEQLIALGVNNWQLKKNNMGAATGGWFGKDGQLDGFAMSVAESDYVFAWLCRSMGGIAAIGVLLLFLTLLVRGNRRLGAMHDRAEMALAYSCLYSLIGQSFICMAANLNLLPAVGLPMAFLSEGKANSVMCFVMVFVLLYAGRKEVSDT